MVICQIIVFLLYAFFIETHQENVSQPRIAIIGAGIGGTSAAYFLHNVERLNATIDVYSKDPVGGRLATQTVAGYEYETGGSILHPKNLYMRTFVEQLGLKVNKGINGKFGLYDGSQFTYHEGNWNIVNLVSLLCRYGFSIAKLDVIINDMLHKFSRIYDLQDEGFVFSNVPDLLRAMDPSFLVMMEQSLEAGLKAEGMSQLFIQELATAVMRVNYGQLTSAHQFVGSVSLAGADSDLWSVQGGNKKVPIALLESSKAQLFNVEIDTIQLIEDGNFGLHLKETDDVLVYDAVILATPLTKDISSLLFENFPNPFEFPGYYHQTICTMVQGDLNYKTFQFTNAESALDEILTINSTLFFNSLSRNYPVNLDDIEDLKSVPPVWKVFSNNPLSQEQLESLFLSINEIHEINWKAYPSYDSSQSLGNFTLYPGLYHVNAIEWAASAMEMSVIGARNVALLTASHFGIDIQDQSIKFHEEL